jgi:signal transduction histidine kinase
MRWLRPLSSWIFPPRASTQTWMTLTFALFVGLAVLAVGLYVVLVLRGEIRDAKQEMLRQQARRIAYRLEQAETRAEQQRILQEISGLTDLRITVASRDSVYWDVQGNRILSDGLLMERPEMRVLDEGGSRYAEREGPQGEPMLYLALSLPRSGLTIRVGQPEPPLARLVRRMQIALVVGLTMAFLLALLGSWVAAYQVTTPLQAIRNSARNISEGELEHKIRVDTRAAEIQELAKSLNRMSESFRKQIDDLQRLAQLQNEFIGNVSHEVRNPIFAVSGYLEALGSPTLGDDQRKRYAEKGLANLQRLNNLFNDLIEIARLEYREDLIQASVFDLQELLEEVAEMLRPKAEEKGLKLEAENPHRGPRHPLLVRASLHRQDRARRARVAGTAGVTAPAFSVPTPPLCIFPAVRPGCRSSSSSGPHRSTPKKAASPSCGSASTPPRSPWAMLASPTAETRLRPTGIRPAWQGARPTAPPSPTSSG